MPSRSRVRFGEGRVFQLRVELVDISPTVWRRLVVSARASLHELHVVIERAMGRDPGIGYEFDVDGVRYINPESFSVSLSISFLSMVVIGGLGTIGGSILGAAFYVIVPELLRGIKDAPGLVFGLLLVVVMVFMPQGLWGMLRRLWRRS